MFIATYFTAACFKEILVSAPWRWRGNRAETYRTYAKDSINYTKLPLLVLYDWRTSQSAANNKIKCFAHNIWK